MKIIIAVVLAIIFALAGFWIFSFLGFFFSFSLTTIFGKPIELFIPIILVLPCFFVVKKLMDSKLRVILYILSIVVALFVAYLFVLVVVMGKVN